MTDFDFSSLNFELPPMNDEQPEEKETVRVYTGDCETDPFSHGEMVYPFAWGLYDGKDFRHTWGSHCTEQYEEMLQGLEPGILYMHNGGKFDFYYLIHLLFQNPVFVVNRRIVRAYIQLPKGRLEIRDSYAIMPFPLKDYDKDEIDYKKMHRSVRNKHKLEILKYLKKDCTSLYELCHGFVERFGAKYLTIGSLSMSVLRSLHDFECLGPYADRAIRDEYYLGGRVQCFQTGILPGPWKVYDVNSMYPSAMRNFLHPFEMPGAETTKIRKDTCFITATGKNNGAFAQKTKAGLQFDIDYGTFHVSRHEWDAALDLDLFRPDKIHRCINFARRSTLEEFVNRYYDLRKQAKISGDRLGAIFYKYILNSAYGKFGQDSAKYFEWKIDRLGADEPPRGNGKRKEVPWSCSMISEDAKFPFMVWKRPSPDYKRYNIATGASITGASRSILMRAIAKADTPIYCDTDSLVCRNLAADGIMIDPNELGAWKLEHDNIDVAMIARKKLYALMSKKKCVKMASKGVKFTASDIRRVCEGKSVLYKNDAPTFHLDGTVSFIEREISL